jgi:sensor histidine kinase YesM
MEKIRFHIIFCIISIIFLIGGINNTPAEAVYNIITRQNNSIRLTHWEIAKDTAPKDSLKNIPDSLWKVFPAPTGNENYTEGNWLLKTDIVIKEPVSSETVWGLFPIYFFSAYEIYWDGVIIARNGIIGTNKITETPGTYNFETPLNPNLVSLGRHTITIRISNYRNYSSWKWYYGNLQIGQYNSGLKAKFRSNYMAFLITGILIIPFLFNIFLYFARKRRPEHLLFSLICLIVILDYLTGLVPMLTNIPTTYVSFELYAYQTTNCLFGILLPAFFILMFSFPKKYIGFIAAINLITLLFFTNIWNVYNIMSITVLVISSIISIWALIARREGSKIIFIGIILAWGVYFLYYTFAGLATIMVLCTSLTIAMQFAKKEKAEREARLRSAQLENELLKKNINPHFLLNTLTSIIVWLRKDPKSAIKLIETLSDEFRMITQISPLKQIPIRQEIELCKAHLKIMSYRKGADYILETIDIAEEENVPPMIFHTLVENGLTHGYENKTQGTFTLRQKRNSNCTQYVLTNDGEYAGDDSNNSRGFGLRYIKSRLEESYPGKWNIESCAHSGGWETIIEIRNK